MSSTSSSSIQLESSGLDGDIRFSLYAAFGALGVAIGLTALFWRLYKLTVSARPQNMLPMVTPHAVAGDVKAKKLRQQDVAALPVFVHGGDTVAAAVECAVCLAEMKDGERGRLLPGCGHRFHVECIDKWFRANSTCPICRAAVVSQTAPVAAKKDGAAPTVAVVVQS